MTINYNLFIVKILIFQEANTQDRGGNTYLPLLLFSIFTFKVKNGVIVEISKFIIFRDLYAKPPLF
jgi:hypothetical protein